MILEHSFQSPKSVMKTRKWVKLTHIVKLRAFVKSEDDKDSIVQLISSEALEVILPRLSTLAVGTSHSPHLLYSPKKYHQLTASSHLEITVTSSNYLKVIKFSTAMSTTLADEPLVIDIGDILIVSPYIHQLIEHTE
ncbi:hypothetical protein CY34DRAFT_109584 [Suillus luteus UH-Slu-Lm8-n1]|uniref:Uncharacterized protein n=1 Tax=Suillus luteus UH-Slu-Lm8-n1 TaxID=930992 RepID=A0A0D0A3K8_9AGAM|nr:hypothetical protein CY34DRAFT_109584 [Suillus luteus UH-Slu-Lm8-n1]